MSTIHSINTEPQKGRSIPNPPRLPIIGNLHQLSSYNPAQHFMKLMEEYGDILRIFTPIGNMIVVKSYEYTKELCDESRFMKNLSRPLIELRGLGGDGLFTAWTTEPNWQKAHNILIPGLGQRAMKGYYPMMLDIAERLLAKWHNIPEGKEFNLTDDMTRLTFDTIGLCGFDYRFHSFSSEKPHPFIDAMATGLEDSMRRMNKIGIQRTLRFKQNYHYRKSLQYMFKVVDDIIAERQAHPEKYQNNTDFMSLMLNATDLETGEKLDPINIRYQILTFLIAGHETTSGLLSFAFYFLMTHPEVLQRAYKEVDTVLGNDLTQTPTYKQVNELKYIQQILFESLRLWPTAPAFSVFAKEDTLLAGRYEVLKGQRFIVLLPGLHRDKKVWGAQADQFNPDNFTPEAIENRPSEAYKPFGNGQRACIGRQFAMLEATLVMGMILQRYQLQLKKDYQLVVKETLTLKPENLIVSLQRRKDESRYYVPKQAKQEKIQLQKEVRFAANPLTIAFGSNMGASEDFALEIAEEAEKLGFPCACLPLDNLIDNLPQSGTLIVITATYNGNPPNNAQRFAKWIATQKTNTGFDKLKFVVFGCGNTQWKTFQIFPRLLDEQLACLGAKRLLPAGEADAASGEFEDTFQKWQHSLWQKLCTQGNEKANLENINHGYQVHKITPQHYRPLRPANRQGELACEVLENKELQQADSERSTRHLEIALPEGTTYQTGDHLGIYPENPAQLVERVCKRFGLARQEILNLQNASKIKKHLPLDTPISVQDLLTHFVELQSPITVKQLQKLIEHTTCPPEKIKLAQYKAQFKTEVQTKNLNLIDLLEEIPACEIGFGEFLSLLSPLQVRYFSISSSALLSPRVCSLTVGVIDEPAYSGKGTYQGICTNYLKNLTKGQQLQAFVQKADNPFRLPEDLSQKTIMIGAGTGLSPLRGFVQELAMQREQGVQVGESMLFFGCRHPSQDFIYQEELENFENEGVIALYPAFSRLGNQKEYVQHKILANQDKIWAWLQEGAVVYVCGDALGMAPAVKEAFKQIYQNQTAAENAAEWLEAMLNHKQYREDVWG